MNHVHDWQSGAGDDEYDECATCGAHRVNPSACTHDAVDSYDMSDGSEPRHIMVNWCEECDSEVMLQGPDEDGQTWWETV
jgi:hypothetical protein